MVSHSSSWLSLSSFSVLSQRSLSSLQVDRLKRLARQQSKNQRIVGILLQKHNTVLRALMVETLESCQLSKDSLLTRFD